MKYLRLAQRFTLACLVPSLVLTLAACSGSESEQASPDGDTPDTPAEVSPQGSPEPSPEPDEPKSEKAQKLEASAKELLEQEIGAPVQSIDCPNEFEVKADSKVECDTQVEAGQFTTLITFQDDQGAFRAQSKGLVILSKLEKELAKAYSEEKNAPATIDCDGDVLLVKVGDTFECKVQPENGEASTVTVQSADEFGQVRFRFN